MPTHQISVVDRVRAAVVQNVVCSLDVLCATIGRVVVIYASQVPAGHPLDEVDRSIFDAASRTTMFLADRIPQGEEALVLAAELVRHHGLEAARALLGDSMKLPESPVLGRLWWSADDMSEAEKWQADLVAKGARVELRPETDRPIVDVLITLDRAKAAEILGYPVANEEWLVEDVIDHPSIPAETSLSRYLVPTFFIVEAASAQVAIEAVSHIQASFADQEISLYIDEGLEPVHISSDVEMEFHTILDEPAIRQAARNLMAADDAPTPGV